MKVRRNNEIISHSLAIARQTSLEVETFCQNGQQKRLHYVIKNNPFFIDVGIEEALLSNTATSRSLDFEDITLEASLLYDCSEDKKVACLKVQPLSYKGIMKEGDSKTCVLELTIGVLSSQHEDMNFKILIQAIDIKTKSKIPNLTIISEPVQVISKPDVLRKKKLPSVPRKNTANTAILDRLSALEQTLARIEKQTCTKSNTPSNSQKDDVRECKAVCVKPPKIGGKRKLSPQEHFENAFYVALEAYANLPVSDRPQKVQKLVGDCNTEQKLNFEELINNASSALNKSRLLLTGTTDVTASTIEIPEDFMTNLDFSEILKEFM